MEASRCERFFFFFSLLEGVHFFSGKWRAPDLSQRSSSAPGNEDEHTHCQWKIRNQDKWTSIYSVCDLFTYYIFIRVELSFQNKSSYIWLKKKKVSNLLVGCPLVSFQPNCRYYFFFLLKFFGSLGKKLGWTIQPHSLLRWRSRCSLITQ